MLGAALLGLVLLVVLPILLLALLAARLRLVLLLVLFVARLSAVLLARLPAGAGALLVFFVFVVVPHGPDRLLDLVLRQAALDGLDELVLRPRAKLLEEIVFRPVALVVEELEDLVLPQARAQQVDELCLGRLRAQLFDEIRLCFRRHLRAPSSGVQGKSPLERVAKRAAASRWLQQSRRARPPGAEAARWRRGGRRASAAPAGRRRTARARRAAGDNRQRWSRRARPWG